MFYPTLYKRNDPFALMRSLMRDVASPPNTYRSQTVFPVVNIWQGDDAMAITAELPGIEPSALEITVKDDLLTISGERAVTDTAKDDVWLRRERSYGKFSRPVQLPFNIDENKVEARFENGVLCVVIGRAEEDKPRKIEVKAA
ncbi:Hsp20/alpha crystallin family protein [Halodesulfovibrio sp.]|uniref:Hsp20/alpha crystallin family protein n=1 Tax=Halodesulfovibrio sp. TaxID=1912772 RepID=UPI0025BE272A|nr:Hsp20/alpha crystallin family protein [Halodesulfovibrio sp.]